MLPRFDRRERIALAVCAAAQTVAVAAVAAAQPNDGAVAVAAALVLAPVAVAAVAATAARFADEWFPVAAAGVFVLVPLLGNRLVLATARGAFDRHALPALLGTKETLLYAAGVAAAVLVALLPERAAAAAGAVGLVVALVVWSPGALGDLQPMLHETAWSVAFPEWILVATIAGLVLRRPLLGGAVACVALAVILRAAHRPYDDAGFWRALGPLVPAAGVLLSGLWLLVPRLRPAGLRRAAS